MAFEEYVAGNPAYNMSAADATEFVAQLAESGIKVTGILTFPFLAGPVVSNFVTVKSLLDQGLDQSQPINIVLVFTPDGKVDENGASQATLLKKVYNSNGKAGGWANSVTTYAQIPGNTGKSQEDIRAEFVLSLLEQPNFLSLIDTALTPGA